MTNYLQGKYAEMLIVHYYNRLVLVTHDMFGKRDKLILIDSDKGYLH